MGHYREGGEVKGVDVTWGEGCGEWGWDQEGV